MQNKLKISDPTKIVTLANMISLLRAVLAVPIVYTLTDPSLGSITLLLILIAILSDALDGWVARRAGEVTHFGPFLDPIADFLCILSVTSYMVLAGRFPAWFFLFYISRYVLIAVLAIYAINRNQFYFSANWWGKWATGITSLALLFHIWPWGAFPWIKDFMILLATALMVLSWCVYIKDFYILFKK